MTVTEGIGLTRFNGLPAPEAEQMLLGCCSARRWAGDVAAGRPYSSPQDLYAAAETALQRLDEADLDEALAGHPRIGEQAAGTQGSWSRREQRRVATANEEALTAIADGNRAYEARFGHVYLVCATGRDAEELLALLRRRLHNDRVTERRVVREELAKINRLRLARLVGEEDAA